MIITSKDINLLNIYKKNSFSLLFVFLKHFQVNKQGEKNQSLLVNLTNLGSKELLPHSYFKREWWPLPDLFIAAAIPAKNLIWDRNERGINRYQGFAYLMADGESESNLYG